MKIEAHISITREEMFAILNSHFESSCFPGRSFGKLPAGEVLCVEPGCGVWLIHWGEKPEDNVPIEPIAPRDRTEPSSLEARAIAQLAKDLGNDGGNIQSLPKNTPGMVADSTSQLITP